MRVAFAAVSLGLLSLSCATPKVKLDEGPREYVATDYDTVLKAWTRDKQFTNVNVMDNVLSSPPPTSRGIFVGRTWCATPKTIA